MGLALKSEKKEEAKLEEPLKEPTIIDAPPGVVLLLLFGSWAGWGTFIFLIGSGEGLAVRLLAALVVGFVLALVSLSVCLVGYPKWQRPMTPEERAKWKEENAKLAAAIQAARENRERHLRQVGERAAQLIAETEADPMIAQMLRTARQDASEETARELLANADIAIAGLGAWLTEQGVPNQLPGDLFASVAKGRINEHFSSLSSKERRALQKYLPRIASLLEEALEVMSPREVVKEVLLPLFFGETTN